MDCQVNQLEDVLLVSTDFENARIASYQEGKSQDATKFNSSTNLNRKNQIKPVPLFTMISPRQRC